MEAELAFPALDSHRAVSLCWHQTQSDSGLRSQKKIGKNFANEPKTGSGVSHNPAQAR